MFEPSRALRRGVRIGNTSTNLNPGLIMLRQMASALRFNAWMADSIRPFIGERVIEFGAGIGNMTLLLSTGCERYVATDSDPLALLELRLRLANQATVTVSQCDLLNTGDIDGYRNSMDSAVCLNVLEHIVGDEQALINLRSCLRVGGRGIVLVPQDPRLFGSLDEVLQHKRRYTQAEIHRKMTAAGFRVERIIPFNRVTYPGWYLNSRVLRRRTLSSFQLRILDVLVPMWRRIDGMLPWPSNSLIAIGSRPR